MLSLLRASDTGACFSPLQVNKTGIDRRSTSPRHVLAAVLNRLCQLWFSSCVPATYACKMRASDTGACFSPLNLKETGIDRRYTSLRRVLAAVLNRLCQLWFCNCCVSPLHMPVKCVLPIQAPASAPFMWKKQLGIDRRYTSLRRVPAALLNS